MPGFEFEGTEYKVDVQRTTTLHDIQSIRAVATPVADQSSSAKSPLELRMITLDPETDKEVTWSGVWSDESNLPLAVAFAAWLLETSTVEAVKLAAETSAFNTDVWFKLVQLHSNQFGFENSSVVKKKAPAGAKV